MNALIEGGKFIIHTTYVQSMSEEGERLMRTLTNPAMKIRPECQNMKAKQYHQ